MGWSVPVPTAREQGLECLLTVGENHHASNHVLQLSDVSRPRVLAEASHRLGRELLCATVLRVEPGQERRRQERNLLFALPEGGNANLHHVEAVVEVLSEFAPRHRMLQVSIRGGDHARVDIDQPVAPHPRETEVLEHMEELGLKRERQFCDLVQVDRALVGILELPWFPPMRAGEGAPLVAEEFGLEEVMRDRCTVHLDEGTVAATGYGMDSARDQIFSHAAFPSDQDRRVSVGDVLDDRPNRPHLRASIEQHDVVGERTLSGLCLCQ